MLFSLALEEAIKMCMTKHTYSLGQESKVQGGGGPIGLKLSGAVAKVFMVWWCREFRNTMARATRNLATFTLHLYKIYVDDQGLVVEELPPGARYLEEEGEVRVVVEGDELIPRDQRTAELLRTVANTICPHTTMEVDYPSAHTTGYMPILDLQVRIRDDKTVDWRFFKKPVASEYFIMSRSAVPSKVKKAALAQEGLRRLRNTRPDLVVEDRVRLMEDLAEGMMLSGYPAHYRESTIRSALTGYRRQVEASQRGVRPLYRAREWGVEERRRKKRLKASWYRPADTVLFLPSTPGSELANKTRKVVEEECRRLDIRVRVAERAGTSLRQHLVRTDLSRGVPCPQGDCPLCLTNPGEGGGLHHHRSGVLYTGTCLVCPNKQGPGFTAVYTGESGDSGYVRTKLHVSSIERRDQSNAFAKHLAEHHPEREGDWRSFQLKVARTFQKPLLRQIWEAVEIHGCDATIILNSRSEWHQPVVDRLVVTREPPTQQGRGGGGGARRGRSQGGGA